MIDALGSGLVRTPPVVDPNGGIMQFIDAAILQNFTTRLTAMIGAIATLRDSGENINVPLLIHTYDYATPRDVGAGPVGPWLYPVLVRNDINPALWIPIATFLINSNGLRHFGGSWAHDHRRRHPRSPQPGIPGQRRSER